MLFAFDDVRVELLENTGPAEVAVFNWGGERVHALLEKGAPRKVGDTVFPHIDPGHFTIWAQQSVVSRTPAT